jgi:protein-disulfide isomerase
MVAKRLRATARGRSLVDGLLVTAVIALLALLGLREWRTWNTSVVAARGGRPSFIREIADLDPEHGGAAQGDSGDLLRVVVFNDFECPYCARFHLQLDSAARLRPGRMRVSSLHFPLKSHRFARQAARAVECADAAGRRQSMMTELFARQDSLGLLPWTVLALRGGVIDTNAFARCHISDASIDATIERDVALARRLDVAGTPTVFVNGWQLVIPPSVEELVGWIDAPSKDKPSRERSPFD